MKEPSLVPEKYALTALKSKEYALLAGKLRSAVVEKAHEMLGMDLEEGQINDELIA